MRVPNFSPYEQGYLRLDQLSSQIHPHYGSADVPVNLGAHAPLDLGRIKELTEKMHLKVLRCGGFYSGAMGYPFSSKEPSRVLICFSLVLGI